jgi:glutathione peroxidase
MNNLNSFFAILLASCLVTSSAAADDKPETKKEGDYPAVLDFEMEKLGGGKVQLGKAYKGKVILIVNVASECGLTPQYEQLQALHEQYGKKGLAIVGVPCNQFAKQEPGDAKEIREFCTKNYGVQFDLLAKVNVNGDDACPLYKFLTSEKKNGKFGGKIKWNFTKFLVSRAGEVTERFEPKIKPDDKNVIAAIERELKKKAPYGKQPSKK